MRAGMPQPIYETAVPDATTVKRDAQGRVSPYVAVQFGDLLQIGTRNMASVVNDDYRLPIYVQSIAGTAKDARRVANLVNRTLLGLSTPYGGQIRKRVGGGMFMLVSAQGAEAYQMPASFAAPLGIIDLSDM